MLKLKKHLLEKKRKYLRRKYRVNTIIKKSKLPRLIVYKSNQYNYAQIVYNGKVIASANDLKLQGKKTERAYQVGVQIGKKALEKGIEKVVFDRNGYKYHGRVKAIAEGARSVGLKF